MSIWLDNIHGSFFSAGYLKHLAFKELTQRKQKKNFGEDTRSNGQIAATYIRFDSI